MAIFYGLKINSFASALLAVLAVASSAESIEYKRAEITKIVDGREVFIDNGQVTVGAVASRGIHAADRTQSGTSAV